MFDKSEISSPVLSEFGFRKFCCPVSGDLLYIMILLYLYYHVINQNSHSVFFLKLQLGRWPSQIMNIFDCCLYVILQFQIDNVLLFCFAKVSVLFTTYLFSLNTHWMRLVTVLFGFLFNMSFSWIGRSNRCCRMIVVWKFSLVAEPKCHAVCKMIVDVCNWK